MPWPSSSDYNEAIQNLCATAGDDELRRGEPAVNSLGLPMPYTGNFADVYKVNCAQTGNTWAVKCFTREVPGLCDRYREISRCLDQARLPFMVDFRYVNEGLRVAGRWFPILKMRWVEGLNLNRFVAESLAQPTMLRQLLDLWVKLSVRLREKGIAHADLQHGNVLLVPEPQSGKLHLRLVDYDGMYVPALSGRRSGELGHPCYQHPARLKEGTYSSDVDRFSHLAIYAGIRCLLVGGRELWDRYDTGENLLFRERDYAAPDQSAVFAELWSMRHPELLALVGNLILAAKSPLHQSPLLSELVVDGKVRSLSREQEHQVNDILGRSSFASLPVAKPLPPPTEVSPALTASQPPAAFPVVVRRRRKAVRGVDSFGTARLRRSWDDVVQRGRSLIDAGRTRPAIRRTAIAVVALTVLTTLMIFAASSPKQESRLLPDPVAALAARVDNSESPVAESLSNDAFARTATDTTDGEPRDPPEKPVSESAITDESAADEAAGPTGKSNAKPADSPPTLHFQTPTAPPSASPASTGVKESELFYDFSNPSQLADFTPESGIWKITDGKLVGFGNNTLEIRIQLNRRLEGDLALSWETQLDSMPELGQLTNTSEPASQLILSEEADHLLPNTGYFRPMAYAHKGRATPLGSSFHQSLALIGHKKGERLAFQSFANADDTQRGEPISFGKNYRFTLQHRLVGGLASLQLEGAGWQVRNSEGFDLRPHYLHLAASGGRVSFDNLRIRSGSSGTAGTVAVIDRAPTVRLAAESKLPGEAPPEFAQLNARFIAEGAKPQWVSDAQSLTYTNMPFGSGFSRYEFQSGVSKRVFNEGKDQAVSPVNPQNFVFVQGSGVTEELWYLGLGSLNSRRLAPGSFPAWAPDGRRVFYHVPSSGKLMALEVDNLGASPAELAAVPGATWYPSFSVDGKWAAFMLPGQIVALNLQDQSRRTWPLPNGIRPRGFLSSWSPDSRYLTYASFGMGEGFGLWLLDTEQSQIRRILSGDVGQSCWSPDGTKLAVDTRPPKSISKIWVIDVPLSR